jgi:hypothetical protein
MSTAQEADAPRDSSTTIPASEFHQYVGTSRQASLSSATRVPGVRTATLTEQHRRLPGRQWPWIQPTPVIPAAEPSGVTPQANAALHNLEHMNPSIHPYNAVYGSHQRAHRIVGNYTELPHNAASSPVDGMSQSHQQDAYSAYVLGSTPSPPNHAHAALSSPIHPTPLASSSPYHAGPRPYHTAPTGISDASSPTYQSSLHHDVSHTQVYANQPHYAEYPYAVSPQHSQSSSSPPVPSPSVVAATVAVTGGPTASISAGGADDTENQPFVVTPEYEALANARFAAAVRSGAMQASMTPTALSPPSVSPVGGHAGYFSIAPHGQTSETRPAPPLPHQHQHRQPTMHMQHETGYVYADHDHDMIHYQPQPGETPAEHATYYQPSGSNGSSQQWYGPSS